jgi:hypothetical protein
MQDGDKASWFGTVVSLIHVDQIGNVPYFVALLGRLKTRFRLEVHGSAFSSQTNITCLSTPGSSTSHVLFSSLGSAYSTTGQ